MQLKQSTNKAGFTIRELIASIVVVVMLIGLTLPVLASVNDNSMVQQSKSNLMMLGIAHALYAADWNDNQWTYMPHDIATYGSSVTGALNSYCSAHPSECAFLNLPRVDLGWGYWPATDNFEFVYLVGHPYFMLPVRFDPANRGFGHSRTMFVKSFNTYVSGKMYDPVFFAPKHHVALDAVGDCFDSPYQFCLTETEVGLAFPTYSLSAAAMYHPEIWEKPFGEFPTSDNGFFTVSGGGGPHAFQVPTFSQVKYPHLKTHVMEHFWLQNNPPDCVPDLELFGMYDDCHSPFFNHSINSAPATLFYDLHIRLLPNKEVQAWDQQTPLWRRDTPFGEAGYFLDYAFDNFVDVSHHVLTHGGARGRDTLGPNHPQPPAIDVQQHSPRIQDQFSSSISSGRE